MTTTRWFFWSQIPYELVGYGTTNWTFRSIFFRKGGEWFGEVGSNQQEGCIGGVEGPTGPEGEQGGEDGSGFGAHPASGPEVEIGGWWDEQNLPPTFK